MDNKKIIDDGNDDVEYENNHKTKLDGSISNIYLEIYKFNFSAIDSEGLYFNRYYTINSPPSQ